VNEEELLEIDRWALAELNSVVERVRAAYEAYEFHTVYQRLYEFCTVTLSARYFDILKDRLYTFAPRNPARRSGLTAIYKITDALARMLAPILVFTADEIWESLPYHNGAFSSVHVALLPTMSGDGNSELLTSWAHLFGYRDAVLAKLEEARIAKVIGSSLDARVEISSGSHVYDTLDRYRNYLRYLFIVSEVELLEPNTEIDRETLKVTITRAHGQKCERCWNYSTHIGESSRYPTVCERCVAALAEIEAGG